MNKKLSIRWLYLAIGTFSMLFAGIIYAWSILKAPLAEEFGWSVNALALNFTLAMCFFCIGGFLGGQITRKLPPSAAIIAAGVLAGAGFICTSFIQSSIVLLYIFYAAVAGLGIGISYNVVISTVNSWFPDKRGLSSGVLLMGFGVSTLLFGNLFDSMFRNPAIGWRTSYILFGAAIAVALLIAGLILRRPAPDIVFPAASAKARDAETAAADLTTAQMVRRSSFWRAFIYLSCLVAVGNSVISFARDLALSVGASAALATTLVGILSVCNGLGRIITGAVFDSLGRRFTMIGANILTAAAAAITLIAVVANSLPLCIAGLCLTGISYGSGPTVCSAFVSAFYGPKHFASNYSVINFTLMAASFIATACNSLLAASGSYIPPFVLLLALSLVALGLNLSIKRP